MTSELVLSLVSRGGAVRTRRCVTHEARESDRLRQGRDDNRSADREGVTSLCSCDVGRKSKSGETVETDASKYQ